MRVRLKYALPLAQMALAVVFLRLTILWIMATRGDDAPGQHPAFHLLLYLNLPIMPILKRLLFGSLLDLALLVAAIGVFWYCIALLIHRYKERGTVFPTGWVALRMAADVVLIAMPTCLGPLFVLEFIENAKDYPAINTFPWSDEVWWWCVPTYGALLMWILGPYSSSAATWSDVFGEGVRRLPTRPRSEAVVWRRPRVGCG
jgi:hypothetical protein